MIIYTDTNFKILYRGITKKEKNKVTRPNLTDEEKELIVNMLLCSLLSEEEILITYYEDGYLLSSNMTVVD
ncbi:YolD-like family protein, partial [Bacillus sp. JJ783]|uniref:YolD-like family protein n=1 Tax=Bacillus sp. JJ783 TaxID=3122974 RepID=UPI00300397C1